MNIDMRSKPRIIIDVDGVLADQATAIVERVNLDFGFSAKRSEVTTWDHPFDAEKRITFTRAIEKYYGLRDFILNMPIQSGAKEFMSEARKYYNVEIATSRTPIAQGATIEWISQHFGTDLIVHFIQDKSRLGGDVLIDDFPLTVLQAVNKGSYGILFLQPWNEWTDLRKGIDAMDFAITTNSFDGLVKRIFDFFSSSQNPLPG